MTSTTKCARVRQNHEHETKRIKIKMGRIFHKPQINVVHLGEHSEFFCCCSHFLSYSYQLSCPPSVFYCIVWLVGCFGIYCKPVQVTFLQILNAFTSYDVMDLVCVCVHFLWLKQIDFLVAAVHVIQLCFFFQFSFCLVQAAASVTMNRFTLNSN